MGQVIASCALVVY